MSKGSAPAAPDYAGAAQQQGAANLQSTLAQAQLNRPTVITPFGTQRWTATPSGNVVGARAPSDPIWGITGWTSPEGPGYGDVSEQNPTPNPTPQPIYGITGYRNPGSAGTDIPNYTGEFELNPEFQSAVDRVGQTVSQPFEYGSANDVEEAYLSRLRPELDRRKESLAQTLANQGIKLGSDSYARAQNIYGQQENDAILQAVAQGIGARGNMLQQAMALRNQPINELTSLVSGQQVAVPQFSPVAAPQAGNIQGATQAAGDYASDVFGFKQQQQASNAQAAASIAALAAWSGF